MGSTKIDQIRVLAENDFVAFVRLVAPHLLIGLIHQELMQWLTRQDAKPNRLVLLPRGHMKSKLAAYYTAWKITRNPAITVLYISATSPLAEKQLYQVKLILDSEIYARYWPEMLKTEEGKRGTVRLKLLELLLMLLVFTQTWWFWMTWSCLIMPTLRMVGTK